MAAANPLWRAPRINGELPKLGINVAERTVSRLVPKRRTPPSQTWRTFLTNHIRDRVTIDFFTVPTARLRVLFVLIVLAPIEAKGTLARPRSPWGDLSVSACCRCGRASIVRAEATR
jgi:putative transposase